jgi:hypothetical protein
MVEQGGQAAIGELDFSARFTNVLVRRTLEVPQRGF